MIARGLLRACSEAWLQPVRRKSRGKMIFKPLPWHRPPIYCDRCLPPPAKKACFDISKVILERGTECHVKLIRAFLYAHYWPREPTILSLYMCHKSDYLRIMTETYCNSIERFLAFEIEPRTGERRLIGVIIGTKVLPWQANELEEWGNGTADRSDRHHMFFMAHCYKGADLAAVHGLPFIFDVSVICTIPDVAGQGVAELLLKELLQNAKIARYPCIQIVATSFYVQKICKRLNKVEEVWSMKYKDYVDDSGMQVFCVRRPHLSVKVYKRFFSFTDGSEDPCLEAW